MGSNPTMVDLAGRRLLEDNDLCSSIVRRLNAKLQVIVIDGLSVLDLNNIDHMFSHMNNVSQN